MNLDNNPNISITIKSYKKKAENYTEKAESYPKKADEHAEDERSPFFL
jgi:hypothetical protein